MWSKRISRVRGHWLLPKVVIRYPSQFLTLARTKSILLSRDQSEPPMEASTSTSSALCRNIPYHASDCRPGRIVYFWKLDAIGGVGVLGQLDWDIVPLVLIRR